MSLQYLKRVKTPLCMQMETVDCGAAALGIMLAYHGCHEPLEKLRSACFVSRDGVSVFHLIEAAKQFGMNATIHQEGLSQGMKPPFILFWNRKHYVVLEGMRADRVYINDPKRGPLVIDKDTFNRQFSGVSIHLHPNAAFKKTSKQRPWAKIILPLFREQWVSFTVMCICMIVVTLIHLTPPLFTKVFIDQFLLKHTPHLTSLLFSVMACAFLAQVFILYIQRKLFRRLETRFATWLTTGLVHHLMRLPLTFFTHRRAGELLYRLQAADRLSSAPWNTVCLTITTTIQALMSFVLMFIYSPLLCLVACLVLSIYVLCMTYCQMRWGHIASMTKTSMASLTALTAQYVSTISQMKAQCLEHVYLQKWQQTLTEYLHAHRQYSLMNNMEQIFSFFIFSMGYLSILAVGVYGVCKHWMTVGEMMACHVLFLSLHDAVSQQFRLGHQYRQIEADVQYIADITDHPVDLIPPFAAGAGAPSNGKHGLGKIQLIDVTFGYSHAFKPLFSHFNMTIEAGSNVAIVGPSGSGKSTLVHLIAGIFKPWSGMILIDGTPLSNFSASERARLIGVVSQDHFFFQGSIRENLSLWGDAYSNAEIRDALRMACVDDLVTQAPEGLDYRLLEGAINLSGGQRQRLEIARTLLGKPRVLLLDEASNSLDPLVEARIKKNLGQYAATRISVAHRLNTIHDADMIFVLKQGELLDYGSHNELISKESAPFKALFSMSE